MEFEAYAFQIKQLKDGGIKLTMDISLSEWDKIKDIPKWTTGIYKISIEPSVEEIDIDDIPLHTGKLPQT